MLSRPSLPFLVCQSQQGLHQGGLLGAAGDMVCEACVYALPDAGYALGLLGCCSVSDARAGRGRGVERMEDWGPISGGVGARRVAPLPWEQ